MNIVKAQARLAATLAKAAEKVEKADIAYTIGGIAAGLTGTLEEFNEEHARS